MTPEIGSEDLIAQLCRESDTAEIRKKPRSTCGAAGAYKLGKQCSAAADLSAQTAKYRTTGGLTL